MVAFISQPSIYDLSRCQPKLHEMKVSASMLVSCACVSVCLSTPYSSQFNSNLTELYLQVDTVPARN